jgi:putative two-component system response regulator
MITTTDAKPNVAPPPSAITVDDEFCVRDLVARWLTAAGYQCTQAASADEAWEHLKDNEVCLAVLDIRMPRRSGIDLLRQIKQKYPDMETILMTAVGETATAIDALTRGACAYLIKPVMREELLLHARRAIERRQLVVDNRDYVGRLEERVRHQTRAIRAAHEETIRRLIAASVCRDEETGNHLRRTGLLSEMLAKAAGWSTPDAEDLRLAAPMHDVGKIGIPDAILRKAGKFTEDEFEIMKSHTVIGASMLAGSKIPMLQVAREIALNHHERWDGSGYPAGLSGYAIPESARIVAIVDVFDALTHNRRYRAMLPEAEALDIMQRGAGAHFDPLLLALFFSLLPEAHRVNSEHPDDVLQAELCTGF